MPFNQILVGRLNRWVQKLLVIKNTALLDLSPNLQPVLPVLNGVEERYLQGWQRYAMTATSAAVAAQLSIVQLRNPPTSQVLVVIEGISIFAGANELVSIFVFPQLSDGGTTLTGTRLSIDRRGSPFPISILSTGTDTLHSFGTGAVYRSFAGLNGVPGQPIQTENMELTVLPGDACELIGELVNTQLSVALIWRERPLESSELT